MYSVGVAFSRCRLGLLCLGMISTRAFRASTLSCSVSKTMLYGKKMGGSMVPSKAGSLVVGKNPHQVAYMKWLKDPSVSLCLGVGPAGTGKTLLACHAAMDSLERGDVSKIVMTRPLVSVHKEDIGFLPGGIGAKLQPWVVPVLDTLAERWSKKALEGMIRDGVIEIAPLGFMRGRTFKRTFVLADEVQNASPDQVLMLITRLGEGSKMAMTGDVLQSDFGAGNGLVDLLRRLDGATHSGLRPSCVGGSAPALRASTEPPTSPPNELVRNSATLPSVPCTFIDKSLCSCSSDEPTDRTAGIRVVRFGKGDVERSPIVRTILGLYDDQ